MNLGDDSRISGWQEGHDPRAQYLQTDTDDALRLFRRCDSEAFGDSTSDPTSDKGMSDYGSVR